MAAIRSGLAAFALLAAVSPGAAHAGDDEDIARAMSAAPAAVAKDATVIRMDPGGVRHVLRTGSNGWTCFPYDEGTPSRSPLCFDKVGLDWYEATMSRKPPNPDAVGLSYMLQGSWLWRQQGGGRVKVTLPPHVMILNARAAAASGYPDIQTIDDTSRPFVVLKGTPFAVIIMPVAALPAQH